MVQTLVYHLDWITPSVLSVQLPTTDQIVAN